MLNCSIRCFSVMWLRDLETGSGTEVYSLLPLGLTLLLDVGADTRKAEPVAILGQFLSSQNSRAPHAWHVIIPFNGCLHL